MRRPLFISLGGFSGFLAVVMGAFAAHALRDRLPAHRVEIFETGARYQLIHSLALLGVGLGAVGDRWARWAGGLFAAGIVLFSGSLYLLAGTGVAGLGVVTPVGGLALLGGWLCLAFGGLRS